MSRWVRAKDFFFRFFMYLTLIRSSVEGKLKKDGRQTDNNNIWEKYLFIHIVVVVVLLWVEPWMWTVAVARRVYGRNESSLI